MDLKRTFAPAALEIRNLASGSINEIRLCNKSSKKYIVRDITWKIWTSLSILPSAIGLPWKNDQYWEPGISGDCETGGQTGQQTIRPVTQHQLIVIQKLDLIDLPRNTC